VSTHVGENQVDEHGQNGSDAAKDAGPDARDAVPTEPHMRTERGRFTQHGASEAAKQRWHSVRAKKNDAEWPDAVESNDPGEDIRIVQAPIRISRIIGGLEREAVQGNAHAARELRAWLQDYPPKDEALRLEDIDRNTRDRILARLLKEIEEDDAAIAAEAIPEDDVDGEQSPRD
jgi:hypothetical protein